MAGVPPLELRIDRHDAWRAGVCLLVALSCATVLAWWLAQPVPTPGWSNAVALSACLGALACGAGLVRRRAPGTLRWDRQQWWLGCGTTPAEAGELGVAIDLGAWMLLRFVPRGRRAWRDARWIAVQRRGLAASWHALRCTVHAPRPPRFPPA